MDQNMASKQDQQNANLMEQCIGHQLLLNGGRAPAQGSVEKVDHIEIKRDGQMDANGNHDEWQSRMAITPFFWVIRSNIDMHSLVIQSMSNEKTLTGHSNADCFIGILIMV